ncbi:unnamed protein product, partial [Discosporangium mesarthrocarpum]
RYGDATEALKQAMGKDPEDGDLLYRAGICAINEGRWSRALKLWRDGLGRSPSHPELLEEASKYNAYAYWRDNLHCAPSLPSSAGVGLGPKTTSQVKPQSPHAPFWPAPPPLSDSTGATASGAAATAAATAAAKGEIFGTGGSTQPSPDLEVSFTGTGDWVCSTLTPALAEEECRAAIEEAEALAAARAGDGGEGAGRGGAGWGTVRHYSVPTTDMPVRELPRTLAWFNHAVREVIIPLIAKARELGEGRNLFYSSATTSPPPEEGVLVQEARGGGLLGGCWAGGGRGDRKDGGSGGGERERVEEEEGNEEEEKEVRGAGMSSSAPFPPPLLRVHDAFIVRYDASAQRSLPQHTDQSELSLTISLNPAGEFRGGGTWFEGLGKAVLPEEAGHVVIFPGGDMMHGGHPITEGVRYVIAVFLYEHKVEEEE